MILNMTGGGAPLNFKVVGGTAEPASPAENMIWVNTDAEITGWVFSPEAPESPAEGLVWIKTGLFSAVAFNALKKNGLRVCPIQAKQRLSGAWADKTAKSFLGGAWTDWWNGELYEAGNLYESVTGGWTSDETTGAPAITYGESSMTITATAAGVNKKVRTGKKIDMSGWSTLTFEGTHENAGDYNLMGLLDDGGNSVASVILRNGHSLDISGITGEFYVYFQVRDASRTTVVTGLYLS
ncbi:hypothetical protein MR626_01425 [bacterium]|nr:hypothetical protein [bacterium]